METHSTPDMSTFKTRENKEEERITERGKQRRNILMCILPTIDCSIGDMHWEY